MALRLWQIPFSTNVERVALALAHKGLEVTPVAVDPCDRSQVRAHTGQELVPVLEEDGAFLVDSLVIMAHLEERWPDAPLFPAAPARREEALALLDWFDGIWKVAPNALADRPDAPEAEIRRWSAALAGSLDRFEALLDGRDWLFGDAPGIVDYAVFPFLKYGVLLNDEDDEAFHRVLAEQLVPQTRHRALRTWIERADALPRAGLSKSAAAS